MTDPQEQPVVAAIPAEQAAVEPVAVEPGIEPELTIPARPRRPKRRPSWPGRLALGLAVAMVVMVGVALAVDAPGRYELASNLATVAIVLSGVGLLLGILAVFARYGRGAAIAAIVIAVLGNPLVLLYGLGFLA